MIKQLKIAALLVLPVMAVSCVAMQNDGTDSIDLAGEWRFTTDSTVWDKTIQLPGSMTSNGLGDDITVGTPWTGQVVDSSFFKSDSYAKYRADGNIKIPFWLQPEKYYKGAAWYSRDVEVPSDWEGQDLTLVLERPHWETRLWIDGKEVGTRNSLGAPHEYDLTGIITPGKHTLTLRIDNRINDIDPGPNSHSISDHTQGNWNGVVGELRLVKRPAVNIAHVDIYPDVKSGSVHVKTNIVNRNDDNAVVELSYKVNGQTVRNEMTVPSGTTVAETEIPMGKDVTLWDEFTPELYTLEASVADKATGAKHSVKERFGMRDIKVTDGRLTINGRPVFMRGTLDCAAFPLTGYPPTDKEEWVKIFSAIKAHGLNHVRYHSWCPPEAAFEVADEMGVYLEIECSSWANTTSSIGDGKPIDDYIIKESEAIVNAYGNHPSFCMMMYGNEPAGAHQGEYLTDFVDKWKTADKRRIYSSAGGWPTLPVNDFHSSPAPRIQGWGQELGSIINSKAPSTDYDWSSITGNSPQPYVSHEIGQWCVYPNFKEMGKYTGVMRPKNFEIFQETLGENAMGELADSFLLASGKLQTLCYKADIEAALRTKDFGGFQLLGLNDFPGQGTALVGTLDAFWEEKGYVTPQEYSRFCNPTVPLARMPKLIYSNTDTLKAALEVAHYGDEPIGEATVKCTLRGSDGRIVWSDSWKKHNIPLGNCIPLGEISVPLNSISGSERLNLAVSVDSNENDWNLWVFKAADDDKCPDDIYMTPVIDEKAVRELERGGKVLLSLKQGSLSSKMGGDIKIGFSSIFWNTAWTGGQAPHTLGLLCNPGHPALREFPTEYHSDYQWWDAMSHSGAIEYAALNPGIKPIVRVIDDWFKNRPLALVFEVKVGNGKLLVSGVDFWNDMENRLEARRLLGSLCRYMSSPAFEPSAAVEAEQLKMLTSE